MKAWLTALGLSLLACWLLSLLAPFLRLVDKPDARKLHEGAVPVVGGLAIIFGFVMAARLAGIAGNFTAAALPLGLILALGVWDDARGIRARNKLLLQIVAVFFLVRITGLQFTFMPLPGPLGVWELGALGLPFTVLLGAGLLNAVNTIDGLDGLSGGVLMLGLLLLAALADAVGLNVIARIALLLQAAVMGFWLLNARFPWQGRARVFLGDAGAFGVGLLMFWLMLQLGGGAQPHVAWPVLMGACWLPMADLAAVAFLRVRMGVSPFVADRRHFHHLLLAYGTSTPMVAILAWILAALVAATVFLMWRAGMSANGILSAQLLAAMIFSSRVHRAWRDRPQT